MLLSFFRGSCQAVHFLEHPFTYFTVYLQEVVVCLTIVVILNHPCTSLSPTVITTLHPPTPPTSPHSTKKQLPLTRNKTWLFMIALSLIAKAEMSLDDYNSLMNECFLSVIFSTNRDERAQETSFSGLYSYNCQTNTWTKLKYESWCLCQFKWW